MQVLASDDGGRSFVHRPTVPWPTYESGLAGATFDGEVLQLDEPASLQARAYWTWKDRLLDHLDAQVRSARAALTVPCGVTSTFHDGPRRRVRNCRTRRARVSSGR